VLSTLFLGDWGTGRTRNLKSASAHFLGGMGTMKFSAEKHFVFQWNCVALQKQIPWNFPTGPQLIWQWNATVMGNDINFQAACHKT
jgi:hypothetical protein